MKKIAIIPTLLTLGNGICGFAPSRLPARSPLPTDQRLRPFAVAGWFILAAMVFDMLDGYVARLSKTASKFGGELDSLCDAISFGVAPAASGSSRRWAPAGIGPSCTSCCGHCRLIHGVCPGLRLARFNVDNTPDPASHKRFRGLPSPGAAGCLASLAICAALCAEARLGAGPRSMCATDPSPGPQIRRGLLSDGPPRPALLMVLVVPYSACYEEILRGRQAPEPPGPGAARRLPDRHPSASLPCS